jgi:hypothetical protein
MMKFLKMAVLAFTISAFSSLNAFAVTQKSAHPKKTSHHQKKVAPQKAISQKTASQKTSSKKSPKVAANSSNNSSKKSPKNTTVVVKYSNETIAKDLEKAYARAEAEANAATETDTDSQPQKQPEKLAEKKIERKSHIQPEAPTEVADAQVEEIVDSHEQMLRDFQKQENQNRHLNEVSQTPKKQQQSIMAPFITAVPDDEVAVEPTPAEKKAAEAARKLAAQQKAEADKAEAAELAKAPTQEDPNLKVIRAMPTEVGGFEVNLIASEAPVDPSMKLARAPQADDGGGVKIILTKVGSTPKASSSQKRRPASLSAPVAIKKVSSKK